MGSAEAFCAVLAVGEVAKSCAVQSSCRTSARASLRESVAEGWQQLAIPAHALDHRSTLGSKLLRPQGHEGEQGEQRGRGA